MFSFDRRMQDMLWRRSKVAAVQISKDFCGAYERRLVGAVPGVDSLWALKEEQRGSRTVIGFNQCNRHSSRVGYGYLNVDWKRVDPFGIDREHVYY